MTSGNPNNLTIYPDYCHALSPTINKWCPLRASDVHSLRSVGMFDDGKEIYYLGNHPIKWVRITGVIVAVDEFTSRKVYTIDDSSGACIECTCPAPARTPTLPGIPGPLNQTSVQPQPVKIAVKADTKQAQPSTPSVTAPLVPWDDLEVGVVVKIKGKPGQFREVKQVEIVKAEVLRGTQQEVKCWGEVLTFRKEVLNIPWVVKIEDEEKLRRKAAREEQFPRKRMKDGKRKEFEIKEKHQEKRKRTKETGMKERLEESKEREKEKEGQGLKAGNKVNYPSLAARKKILEAAKGKYDALGI